MDPAVDLSEAPLRPRQEVGDEPTTVRDLFTVLLREGQAVKDPEGLRGLCGGDPQLRRQLDEALVLQHPGVVPR